MLEVVWLTPLVPTEKCPVRTEPRLLKAEIIGLELFCDEPELLPTVLVLFELPECVLLWLIELVELLLLGKPKKPLRPEPMELLLCEPLLFPAFEPLPVFEPMLEFEPPEDPLFRLTVYWLLLPCELLD